MPSSALFFTLRALSAVGLLSDLVGQIDEYRVWYDDPHLVEQAHRCEEQQREQAGDDRGEEEERPDLGRVRSARGPWRRTSSPLLASPTVSAMAFTTSLPTPERNEVKAMKSRRELVTLPPDATPP